MGITIAVITATNQKTAVSNFYLFLFACFIPYWYYLLIRLKKKLSQLLISAYNCDLSKEKFLCSDNSTCIPVKNVCDGSPDCPKGDDESSSCHFAKEECKSNKCPKDAKCHSLPSGSVCICPKGYQFNVTSAKCEVSSMLNDQFD